MKRFYGYNKTTPDAEYHDGTEFAKETIPDDEWDEIADKCDKGIGKRKNSLFTYARMLLLVAVLLYLETFINKEETEGFEEILFHPISIVVYFVCLGIVVFELIKRFNSKEEKRAARGGDVEDCKKTEASDLDAPFYKRLGVLSNAKKVDLLSFEYDPENDESKDVNDCINNEVRVFVKDESLCFADTEMRYEIPLSELKSMKLVNREVAMIFWNKKDAYNKPMYTMYNIVKKKDNYVIPKYYELEFEHDGELWIISFPQYELSVFKELTGISEE